jgi:hypothetical protein
VHAAIVLEMICMPCFPLGNSGVVGEGGRLTTWSGAPGSPIPGPGGSRYSPDMREKYILMLY